MPRIIITVVILCIYTPLQGQIKVDTISIIRNPFQDSYRYHNQPLTNAELGQLVQHLPEAQSEFKKFQSYKRWALITSITAVALIPWAILPNTPDDTREAIGYTFIGLELITIPLHFEKFSHKKKTVKLFNQSVLSSSK